MSLDTLEPLFLSAIEHLELDIQRNFLPYKAYLKLLNKWNKAYNLTAIRDKESMMTHHIFESLAVLPFLNGEHCLDVGTGAGLPGLILAIAQPQRQWTLVDSNIKKTRFVNQVKLELELDNVEIHHGRIEDFSPDASYNTVISRAFTALKGFYLSCERFTNEKGVLLAMKNGFPEDEMQALMEITDKAIFHELMVPGIEEKRGMVVIRD